MLKAASCVVATMMVLSALGHAHAAMILQTAIFGGHTYDLVRDDAGSRLTWADAEAFAVTLGGHLSTVDNAAENSFLLATFGPTALAHAPAGAGLVSLWLGLSDAAQEGTFVWAGGAPLSYTNWVPGEPAGGFADEDYGAMVVGAGFGTPGQWHDVVSNFRLNDFTLGVAETAGVPESSSALLFCIGVVVLLYAQTSRLHAAS
jgi:hypothetical protein